MNRVHIKTYGCQMNERDSEAVAAMLRGRGYSIVSDEADADIVLLNTCSVRELAEQKAMGKAGHLRKRRRKNPDFMIGVMGCMAQNRGVNILDRLPDLDLLVGTQKFHAVPDHLDHLIATRQGQGPRPATIIDLDAEEGSQNTIRAHSEERKISAFVSIMQGCNMKCSYCIVPKTRGEERARPMDDIVAEIEELARNGTKEVTLLGQIVNQYAVREFPFANGKSPFVQLLERVNAIDGIERIRFTSPHPVGFREDLIECYGRLEKLCEYIHFPMQSGSDRILKQMRRPYTVERFKRIVAALRARCPDLCISTDVIVGFPGETEEDFELTRQAFADIRFDMAYIFKYSVRPGTTAEPLGDPISDELKMQRNQLLLDQLEEYSLAHNKTLLGTVQEVLIESPARKGEGMFVGRNRGYRKIVLPASERLVGELVQVKITEASSTTLIGELVLEGVEVGV
ncbi:tRNA (N6-isopentenyl adenosine(37)-C2)-methylthiotransferase MiaB [Cerasicoccus arenae]|uniref:tRNA-2-methylthio-N(6)-dimethylallyladenosine synthase n=1 Tax=Cerasicoccus arenae TaxID=424488 RepID=A0A8J3GE56_9BACT|nr:tRNA (N6-isopentenyl adenosine(37)-C2)-methylthiotransferase MiaB [Cerasicoccus arenae]MBK1857809.1 tRNA (N6-isopentenyl adenosine(37)-C2)-methylthiotransferase MiaB [Cerasicoccus arenae]GHC11747.1 tRNA-2-methylthio-N(6)-dimethylallyladenosine synthase [Cerasicoccus arenae]